MTFGPVHQRLHAKLCMKKAGLLHTSIRTVTSATTPSCASSSGHAAGQTIDVKQVSRVRCWMGMRRNFSRTFVTALPTPPITVGHSACSTSYSACSPTTHSAGCGTHTLEQSQSAESLIFNVVDGCKKKDLGRVSLSLTGQFYQRSLPAAQVPFSSAKGRQLFREALADGYMENYFFLAEQFRTQDEPTFCGLTTLAMVLNSLRIDPMRTWKGAWRWISEDTLCCCTTKDKVRQEGLSFDMFRSLAICQGAQVDSVRAPLQRPTDLQGYRSDVESSADFAESFREAVRTVACSGDRECLVVCYSRECLGQTGAGHFSPIGGFHAGSDSVLIMDVARFKYPPHWVPVQEITEAMMKIDPETGQSRGFLRLRLEDDKQHETRSLGPVSMPSVPAAAGRRLTEALAASLASQCKALVNESAATVTIRRWLHAASTVEPQVMKRLLEVGDSLALVGVLTRLSNWPVYTELCDAYALLVSSAGGFQGTFPPLGSIASKQLCSESDSELVLGLETHGELWILLLLLLPQHLRAAVSDELGCAAIPHILATQVKGPWALPLEALRETLGRTLSTHRCQAVGPVADDRIQTRVVGKRAKVYGSNNSGGNASSTRRKRLRRT